MDEGYNYDGPDKRVRYDNARGLPPRGQEQMFGYMENWRDENSGRRNLNRNQDENGTGNNPQNENVRRNNQRKPNLFIEFKALEEMSRLDSNDIIIKINQRKDAFQKLLESHVDDDKKDYVVLIIKIISKVCQSSFDELKLKQLLGICNSQFVGNLLIYLTNLPFAEIKHRNRLYWNNPQEFWDNFTIFCQCIIDLSPATALHKCRSLIEATSKCCLENLTTRHSFNLSPECETKLIQMRERLTSFEREDKAHSQRNARTSNMVTEDGEPPENFRELSVIPSCEELLERRPFVRANRVHGGYADVEHYLDVQFRLLREDCFGPLRDGIYQYLENPNKGKFDNIRVYRNVKFIEPYISKTKIGVTIKLDQKTTTRLKKINWAFSKKFIFGSLLLFTKDNCRSFITATILDRDTEMLSEGKIPVTVVDMITDDMLNDESYIMIESEVYFEPYYHVLKALQDPTFPEHIAMSKYIVNVDPVPRSPTYLSSNCEFAVTTENSPSTKFTVLQESTWPTKEDLGLNESQYEAYKLALTHEFSVIQGPPGTGKTYLGVKVAKTLIENIKPDNGACLMLVICYTNHALDQFLQELLVVTNSIVRFGGQSRNEAMEELNITTRRRTTKVSHYLDDMFFEHKLNLRVAVQELQQAKERLETLNNSIVSYSSLKVYARESRIVGEYYANYRPEIKSDPINHWLFENMQYVELQNILMETNNDEQNVLTANEVDDDIFERVKMTIDDFGEEDDVDTDFVFDQEINTSFSILDTEKQLITLILLYNKTEDMQKQLELRRKMVDLKSRLKLFNEMAGMATGDVKLRLNAMNPMRVPVVDRWIYYFKWANYVTNALKLHIKPLQDNLKLANTLYEESRMMKDLKVLQGIQVVGMTTSGAARLRKLLQGLKPTIVIVEEAAEVLEQHIVTSLTKYCKHLILIGDHQQLRPSAAYTRLARHYNLEVSLFERMVANGMHGRCLDTQHRMRPAIAALVAPHIYADLRNHASVERFPSVRGVADDLFFLTHDFQEEADINDSASKSNQKEADMALGLANYLMQQGYEAQDVTVLTAYSGQMFYMRKQREKYAHLGKVKITVVDNYQGEESRIIILSLVRNNKENKIGFLGISNRICVALSRAREGFYIFGNIEILKTKSELWKNIASTLESNASLGSALMLKCENHSEQISTISTPKDFEKVPEGGCLLKCNFNLPCGHRCPLVCHGYDRGHVKTKCYLKCDRVLCELGHVCPFICWKKCDPCKRLVMKTLPCGHQMLVECYREPTDSSIKCLTTVTVTLKACGHKTKKSCHMDTAQVKCPVPCGYRVDRCGHLCARKCHVLDDPDHERYLCMKPCAKAKKSCTAELIGDRGDHQCRNKCHEECDYCNVEVTKKRSTCKHSLRVACNLDVDDTPCHNNCARMLECGHHCKKKCFEKCGDCNQKVKKTIPDCGHEVQLLCMQEATRNLCKQNCERILRCGHRCVDKCSKICDETNCNVLIEDKLASPCGHRVMVPCKVYHHAAGTPLSPETLLEHCTEPCGADLTCGHRCGGTCACCRQRRLHASCGQRCHQTNICGHQCEEPCNQVCPPCRKPCEIKCPHSRCRKLCGEKCTSCNEKCGRACPHGACTRRCGEPCDREPCDEPCNKTLGCGHRCRGLCGEPCPAICNVCRPDEFPRDFLGDEFAEDDKFIQLQDCPHVMDVENMDTLMKGDKETVTIRACPYCRKPIINTYRYKDLVNSMFDTEINPIKERVYGNVAVIKARKEELLTRIVALFESSSDLFRENKHLKKAFEKLRTVVMSQKKVSLLKLDMQFQYLDILAMTEEYYRKYKATNLTTLSVEFLQLIEIICSVLVANVQKISQQIQMDIRNEFKRLHSIIQLAQILSHPSYVSSQNATKISSAANAAKSCVLSRCVFDNNKAVIALKELQEAVNVFGIVMKEERDLIVKAIGSKAGSWYKCPNGHFYSIADCGGAMQVSKCADCGAAVGGTSHRLLSTNRHAAELDGSAHAAWPIGNDMANYRF